MQTAGDRILGACPAGLLKESYLYSLEVEESGGFYPYEIDRNSQDRRDLGGFVGAFPVGEPEFLHMWMNHPSNGESNHYYAEFQPWVPIYQKTIRYFSYYLWGAGGSWKNALEELRNRNLITSIK